MDLGWLAVIGAILLVAGLGTLVYDGLRTHRGRSSYPFPDIATSLIDDTSIQPSPQPSAQSPRFSLRAPRLSIVPQLSKRFTGLRRPPPSPASLRADFLSRVLFSLPRRSLAIIVVGSLALVGVSLTVLAEGSSTPSFAGSQVVLALAPFGNTPAETQAQSALASYIAQSAASTGPTSLVVRTLKSAPGDSATAPQLLATSHADFLLWGDVGADGALTVTFDIAPSFKVGRMPWQELNDPDIDSLVLPNESEELFPSGAGTDPLVPLSLALADLKVGRYKQAADAAWGAQATLDQAGASGQLAGIAEAEAQLAQGRYQQSLTTLSNLERGVGTSGPLPDEGLIVRALANFYTGDYSGAADDTGNVIGDRGATDQVLSLAHLVRGRARYSSGDLTGGLSDLDESARLDSTNPRVHLERAEVLYRLARPSEAATELSAILEKEPDAAPAYRLSGLVQLMLGNPQSALTSLDKAYALYTGWIAQLRTGEASSSATGDTASAQIATDGIVALNSRLAEIALYQGMAFADIARGEPKESFLGGLWRGIRGEPTTWDRALTKMQEAQRLDSRRADVPLQMGSLYAEQGDYANATKALQQARDLDPSAPAPYLALAQLQAGQNQPKDAIATLNDLLSRQPAYYPAYEQIYNLYTAQGDNASAQSTLEGALALSAQSSEDHLWHAKFLTSLGRAIEAESELRIAGQDPQQWEAHLLLGNLLLNDGRAPDALAEYQTVLSIQPNNESALLQAGKLLVLAGRQSDAQTLFERLTSVAPNNVDGHLALLQLLLTTGDSNRAIAEGKKAVSLDATRSDAHYYLGTAYESTSDWHDTSGEYFAATQSDPKNAQAFLSLAKSLFMEDRYQESVSAATSALALRSDYAQAYRWKGEAQLALGDVDGATATVSTMLQLDGNNADDLALAARVYDARGDRSAATGYAQQAISAFPSNPAGQLALGEIMLQSGSAQDALQAFRSVGNTGDARSQALALTGEGRAYVLLGDNDRALKSYDLATQRDVTAGEPYLYMGNLFSLAKQWDQAFQAYHQAVQLRPNWPLALYYLGNAYLQRGDLQNAQAAFTKAVTYSPNLVEGWFGLGIAQRDQGHLPEAINALNKATQLNGNYAQAWLYLGLTYEETGQQSAAADAFSRAKTSATDPDIASQAEQGLARVQGSSQGH